MADAKLTALTALASPSSDDILYIVDDPGGSPVSKKITFANLTATLATLTGTEALTNKTIGNTNTLSIKDTLFRLQDDGDATKLLAFQLSGITTGTTRTVTIPDADLTMVGLATTQTLTNKTIDLSSNTLTGTIAQFNTACSDADFATLAGSETLTNKTLTSPTINTPTLGGAAQLAENASIALDAAGSADGKYSGITIAGTAGTTLAFGDLVYLAAADSRWELTDANAAATAGDVLIGMCVLAAAADGDPTTILLYGNIRADAAFPALTISAPAYVSTTAGDIQTAQPSGTDDVIRRVGFALTADELLFNPSNDYTTHV